MKSFAGLVDKEQEFTGQYVVQKLFDEVARMVP